MTHPVRNIAALLAVGIVSLLMLPGAAGANRPRRAQPLSLTHQHQYRAVPVCAQPSSGHGACLALRVARRGVPTTTRSARVQQLRAAAKVAPGAAPSPASGEIGYTPGQLHIAYVLPTAAPSVQTIALVDAYHDPTAEADLKAYDQEFGLPECTAANGCFKQVNEKGETGKPPFPASTAELEEALVSPDEERREEAEDAEGWGLEISLDVETAHAICQSCNIVLVEASSTFQTSLAAAVQAAAASVKATEISNSWGGSECVRFGPCLPEESAFNHPGIVITASAGDAGYLNWGFGDPARAYANFPASQAHVVAVGGTRLIIDPESAEYTGETVWNGNGAGGGGCSAHFTAPAWQQALASWATVGCAAKRAVSDVSADADPFTGVAVRYSRAAECSTEYETSPGKFALLPNWCQVGGTSLASPLVAAVYALAGGSGGVSYPAATLYESELAKPASLNDVTEGSNGECEQPYDPETGLSGCSIAEEAAQCSNQRVCRAGAGYDGPTGVGTPHGVEAFVPGENAIIGGEEPQEGISPGPPPQSGATPGGGEGGLPGAPKTPTIVSRLALTVRALKALARRRASLASVSFSFVINRTSHVRIYFSRRVRRNHRGRWATFAKAYSVNAVTGANAMHLHGRRSLPRGTYRLTLAPLSGTPRSIEFTLG